MRPRRPPGSHEDVGHILVRLGVDPLHHSLRDNNNNNNNNNHHHQPILIIIIMIIIISL